MPNRQFRMILEHGQNVDLMYGQGNGSGYWEPTTDPDMIMVDVDSLKEASKVFRAWIDRNHLGGGNMTQSSGLVCRTDNGLPFAKISFNGRVWTPYPYGHEQHKEIKIA